MPDRFRRIDPELVSAWQYTGGGELPANVPEGIDPRPIPNDGLYWFDCGGKQRCWPGDWIVCDEDGGYTAWRDEVFRATFEAVDDA